MSDEIETKFAMPFINKGAKLDVPRKQIFPDGHELMLQCKCGNVNHFAPFVVPVPDQPGLARVSRIVCLQCSHILPCDDRGVIQADGTATKFN